MDSARLADALHEQGVRRRRPVDVLLQVNVSGEGTKGGYTPADVVPEAERLRDAAGDRRAGGDDDGAVRRAGVRAAGDLRRRTGSARGARRRPGIRRSSSRWACPGDYDVAVEEGATMIRLGTLLFGARG